MTAGTQPRSRIAASVARKPVRLDVRSPLGGALRSAFRAALCKVSGESR